MSDFCSQTSLQVDKAISEEWGKIYFKFKQTDQNSL